MRLFKYAIFLTIPLLLFAGCTHRPSVPCALDSTQEAGCSALLPLTEDRGQAYLDSLIFFGESTTYHMKSRGVLSGGTETKQIWAPKSGTVNLDATVTTIPLLYPDTGEYLTLDEAMRRKRPSGIVLTFGLNGAVQNVRRGEEYYKSCYRLLLDTVLGASPNTCVILQSAFPVAASMDMSRYSVTAAELNRCISVINGWVLELAGEYGVGYLNSAEILTDSRGFLREEYQIGDGHHLTKDAYLQILAYLRTHAPNKRKEL